MTFLPRIFLTPGEPAGIGPDLVLQIIQHPWPVELIIVANEALLAERARLLQLPIRMVPWQSENRRTAHQPGLIKLLSVPLPVPCEAGKPVVANASYVLTCLDLAVSACLYDDKTSALVTGPVHKGILNEAGIHFSGHTEYLAKLCQVEQTVMLFVTPTWKVALLTTHLPLASVPQAVTAEKLEIVIKILSQGLKRFFKIDSATIAVCGLNPHAGEGGYLGREEIEVIEPTLAELRRHGYVLLGPLAADTIFARQRALSYDAILALYHDQALPVIKAHDFGDSVNVTLGLPFLRTSVDHGTAFDVAGSGRADASSLIAAITLAVKTVARETG